MIQITFNNRPPKDATLKKVREGLNKLLERKDVGFLRLPKYDDAWTECAQHVADIRSDYDHLVVVGIGGSSLGGKVFASLVDHPQISFLENVDPLSTARLLRNLTDLKRTHWVFVSKSGSTIETLAHLNFMHQYLATRGIQLGSQSTVITTDASNPLSDWAVQNKVRRLFIPVDVGGRYSALSAVGLFPAAWAGLSLAEIRQGALWALSQHEVVHNISASIMESWQREEWVGLLWNYCDGLSTFGAWTQQLWAESLAKKHNRQGGAAPRVSFPVPGLGVVDQHSTLQQVVEGARDKWLWLTRVEEAEEQGPVLQSAVTSHSEIFVGRTMGQVLAAEAEATSLALDQHGVSCLVWKWSEVSAKSMGSALMIIELVIATLGEVLDINAYDQPGVELGKKLAQEILRK